MAREARKILQGRWRLLFVAMAKMTRLFPARVRNTSSENMLPSSNNKLLDSFMDRWIDR
jgi:hypothetical protein